MEKGGHVGWSAPGAANNSSIFLSGDAMTFLGGPGSWPRSLQLEEHAEERLTRQRCRRSAAGGTSWVGANWYV